MRRVKLFVILRMPLELIENVYISMDGGGPEIVVTCLVMSVWDSAVDGTSL